jgi:hypothetical protein
MNDLVNILTFPFGILRKSLEYSGINSDIVHLLEKEAAKESSNLSEKEKKSLERVIERTKGTRDPHVDIANSILMEGLTYGMIGYGAYQTFGHNYALAIGLYGIGIAGRLAMHSNLNAGILKAERFRKNIQDSLRNKEE